LSQIVDPLGKTLEQILARRIGDDNWDGSNWHFFQCKSWLDLAKRTQHPSLIHFAAFDLRYGIEYLLFELLVLSSETLSEKQYKKCIGDPHEIEKMLRPHAANYEKLAEFTQVVVGLSNPQMKLHRWDIRKLFAAWGVASSYLHFVGTHRDNQRSDSWLIQSIVRLEEHLDPIWKAITESHAIGVMPPSRMVAKTKEAWNDYSAGKLSSEDLAIRLKILFPNAWISGTQILGI
jgi:hypothetical protein